MMRNPFRIFLLTLVTGLFLAAPAGAQSRKDKEKLARYDKDIKEIRSQIKSLEASGNDAANKLRFIGAEIDTRNAQLRETGSQLDSLGYERRRTLFRLDSLQMREDTLLRSVSTLTRAAYKIRGSRHWYLYVFSGDSFMQGVRRARYMRSLGENLRSQALELHEVREELRADSLKLDSLVAGVESLYNLQLQGRKELEKNRKEAERLVNTIKKDKKSYQQRLDAKLRERNALKREIDAAIAQANKSSKSAKKSSGTKKKASGERVGSTEIDANLGGRFNASSNKGKLPWPATGVVVEHFGDNVDPVYHTRIHSDGMTLSVKPGAEVRAIYEGVVTSAVKSKFKFNYIIIIQHGGNYRTIYCCLDDNIKVKAGDKVKTGQLLGHAVVSGGASEIFFQIRDAADKPVDPRPWLR